MTYSEWLKGRGHDEDALRADEIHGTPRLNQLMSFFKDEQKAPPPASCKDSAGVALKPGDRVTITYQISATHAVIDSDTGALAPDIATLNLDRILPDGNLMHSISVTSDQVKKI